MWSTGRLRHNNIGNLLIQTRRPAEALASYKRALAIQERLAAENPSAIKFQSELARSHNSVGLLLSETGRPADAQASYERALAIQEQLAAQHPESPALASGLGATLNNIAMIDLGERRFEEARARLKRAIEWQRKALASNPNHPTYRQFLRNHLTSLVKAADGLGFADEANQARRELAANDPAKAALDARLVTVLKGQAPKDDAERLRLAYRAYEKTRHAASARLFAEALANDPKLVNDRQAQYAYNAACAAALAGCGQGKDEMVSNETARARLRSQTLDWLRAELAAWTKVIDASPAEAQKALAALRHWKTDSDLIGIRDEKELAKLPQAEREAFRQLWADVERLLATPPHP